MTVIEAILNNVGFDVVIVGTVLGGAALLAVRLLDTRRSPWKLVPGRDELRRWYDATHLSPYVAAAAMVAVVLATGFVGNSLSDQLFDLDGLRIGFQIFESREPVAIPPDSSCDPLPDLPGLRAEDALKQDVALDLCRAQSVGSEARLQLASRVTPNGAKQLRQDARSKLGELLPQFLGVVVLRAVTLGALVVLLAAVTRALLAAVRATLIALKPRLAGVMAATATIGGRPASGPPFVVGDDVDSVSAVLRRQPDRQVDGFAGRQPRAMWRDLRACAVVAIVSAFVASVAFLLWQEESIKYYRRLFNEYLDRVGWSRSAAAVSARPVLQIIASADFQSRDDAGVTSGFEFSGVATIGDRIFVVDNETAQLWLRNGQEHTPHALFALTAEASKPTEVIAERPSGVRWSPEWNDIEGLTSRDNRLYAIGSHGLTSAGVFEAARHVLVRIRFDPATGSTSTDVFPRLTELLVRNAAALGLTVDRATDLSGVTHDVVEGLQIEGLAAVATSPDLFVGIRAPRAGNEAVVLRITDADRLFSHGDTPVAIEARLPLNGRGISSLEYDPASRGYLVTTAPADTGSGESTIWLWRPDRTPALKEVWRVPGRLEGIGRASWPDETNRQRSVLVLALDQELQVRQQREQFGRIVLLANDGFD